MDIWTAILAISYSIFAFVGVAGNTLMLIATLKSKKLRFVCHYLIFALCLADILHLLRQIPNAVSLFLQKEFPQSSCFFLLLPSLVGAVSSSLICLALGVDRLIAVVFPQFYRRSSRHILRFLSAYSILPIAYTLRILKVSYRTRSDSLINLCAVPMALNPVAFSLFSKTTVVINLIICLTYLVAWLIIQKKTFGDNFKKIFKSITLTVMLIVFGWFTTMIINSLSFMLIEDDNVKIIVQLFAGFIVNGSACANIFVYYSINSEYRNAILSIFRKKDGNGRGASIASTGQISRI